MAIASSVTLMQGTPADLARGPTVAVVTTWNEAAPCNIELRHHASAAKVGIRQAGGVAIETSTIAVTDGIAMGTPGMRAVARQPGDYRRLGGSVLPAQRRRRPTGDSGMRQDTPGTDDGNVPARSAVGVYVWRYLGPG